MERWRGAFDHGLAGRAKRASICSSISGVQNPQLGMRDDVIPVPVEAPVEWTLEERGHGVRPPLGSPRRRETLVVEPPRGRVDALGVDEDPRDVEHPLALLRHDDPPLAEGSLVLDVVAETALLDGLSGERSLVDGGNRVGPQRLHVRLRGDGLGVGHDRLGAAEADEVAILVTPHPYAAIEEIDERPHLASGLVASEPIEVADDEDGELPPRCGGEHVPPPVPLHEATAHVVVDEDVPLRIEVPSLRADRLGPGLRLDGDRVDPRLLAVLVLLREADVERCLSLLCYRRLHRGTSLPRSRPPAAATARGSLMPCKSPVLARGCQQARRGGGVVGAHRVAVVASAERVRVSVKADRQRLRLRKMSAARRWAMASACSGVSRAVATTHRPPSASTCSTRRSAFTGGAPCSSSSRCAGSGRWAQPCSTCSCGGTLPAPHPPFRFSTAPRTNS